MKKDNAAQADKMWLKKKIQLSTLHRFEYGGRRYLYNTDTSDILEISKPADVFLGILLEKKSFKEKGELIKKYLSEKDTREIFISLEKNGVIQKRKKGGVKEKITLPGIDKLTLVVSQLCNLRCRYCCAGDGSFGSKTGLMNEETAFKAVDFLFDNLKNRKEGKLTLFGGEPLLNWPAIKKTVEYLREQEKKRKKRINISLLTNGTLLTEEMVNFCQKQALHLQISLDGTKIGHDKNRIFPDGRGSYTSIVGIVKSIRDKANVSVLMTVTHRNLELFQSLKNFLKLGIKNIRFELVSSLDREQQLTKEDLEKIKKEFIKIDNLFFSRLRKENRFYLFNLESLLGLILGSARRNFYCFHGVKDFAVSTEGDLYGCMFAVENPYFKVGSVKRGINDAIKRKLIKRLFVENFPGCKFCWAKYFCGGGCAYERYLYRKHISTNRNEIKCEYLKFMAEQALKGYIKLKKKEAS